MRAKLTISLGAIQQNHVILSETAAQSLCAAVVKADAYGLGLDPVAQCLTQSGVTTFFVALAEEGVALRAIAPQATIYVLNGILPGEERLFAEHNLCPVLNSAEAVILWRAYAHRHSKVLSAALHIDTGLNRLGLNPGEVENLDVKGLQIELVMSHLASADTPDHWMNREQLKRFSQAAAFFPKAKKSLAASDGIFCGPDFHFDMVRPGAALYGINPIPSKQNPMQPVIQISAPVLQTRIVEQNGTVGYAVTREVTQGQRLATISLGYADGFMRSLSNQGVLFYQDTPLPVLGRVSMDVVVVDISALPEDALKAGDFVQVFNTQQTPDMLGQKAGTIGYEILTSLGRRFERVYTS